MKIVTGYCGVPHISSNDTQGFNQGVVGTGNYVFNVGSKFSAELTDVNTVTIGDGEGIMQGVHFRIEPGESETVNIANGQVGYYRRDLICARYTKNSLTGIESVSLVVLQGEESASNPVEPTYNEGDILDGATVADFPLYMVSLNGITPTLNKYFEVVNASSPFMSLFKSENFKTEDLTGDYITSGSISYSRIGSLLLFFASVKPNQNISTALGNVYVDDQDDFDAFLVPMAYLVSNDASTGGVQNLEAWTLELEDGFHISGAMTSGVTYYFGGVAIVV